MAKKKKKYNDVKKFVGVVKNSSFYFYIYGRICENKYPADISTELGIKRQNVNYYIKKLKEEGLIHKIGYMQWRPTKKYSFMEVKEICKNFKRCKRLSLGLRIDKPLTNLHALNFKFPILSGELFDGDWQVGEKLRHWVAKYKRLDNFGGLTLKNNNNKSISVFVKARNICSVDEVHKLAFQVKLFVCEWFKIRDVIIDVANIETKNLDVATRDKQAEGMRGKGEKFTLHLGKKSEKIFVKDDIDGKSWIDGSPFDFSAESNDLEWKREYLNMPFSIRELKRVLPIFTQSLKAYAEQIDVHLPVERKTGETLDKMNIMFGEMNKTLKAIQKSLVKR